MIDVNKTVELLNDYGATVKVVSWAQVVVFCLQHVPSFKRKNWIERARRAFHRGDGERLGRMILS